MSTGEVRKSTGLYFDSMEIKTQVLSTLLGLPSTMIYKVLSEYNLLPFSAPISTSPVLLTFAKLSSSKLTALKTFISILIS